MVAATETEAEQGQLIVPDKRLNLLIIYADQQRTERILNLINKLDLPTEKEVAHSQFKLYTLQHAMAKAVAILLKEVTGLMIRLLYSEAYSMNTLASASRKFPVWGICQ